MKKVRKQFILEAAKIRKVRKFLKASTDTEAVNRAFDLVLANAEINSLHRRLMGRLSLKNMDQSQF